MKRLLLLLTLCAFFMMPKAQPSETPQFSTAGFYAIPDAGRTVYSLNPGWRFYKGDVKGAERMDFDDRQWEKVNLPNGIETLPLDASGCVNYQGVVWYRKHFNLPSAVRSQQFLLHFEAIMGKSKVFINGQLAATHYGGYLPVVVDATPYLRQTGDNVIAVWADNSNDGTYPPGKPQETLDFTYFGGIYRDCWLVAHQEVFLTDPNLEQVVAGGGLSVYFPKVSEQSAEVGLKAHVRNRSSKVFRGSIEYTLTHPVTHQSVQRKQRISILPDSASSIATQLVVKKPSLWSPDDPQLYDLVVRIKNRSGKVVDGYRKRVGIRSFAFKGKAGFFLNGKHYAQPLIGANRHQDYAYVGNAVSNNLHWRDAKKLRDAGLKVIRNAHCPQDPAFMDACDELGLLVIVNTPGWQYWNNAPEFAARVYNDIRQLVRRDRDHACVWMWEPILNETWYPADFAARTTQLVHEEYPYPSCYTACDSEARGHEHFPILFAHPTNGNTRHAVKELADSITYFTREWGDNVDDWNSHNSPSRVARNWGEVPMLVQAQHYAKPPYPYTCYDALYRTSPQHIGGCLWHSFDHQRGYHPDPFYGGIMDAFRQPKYAYYLFQAQRPAVVEHRPYATGPMVYIAHEMTPFSPAAVTVYSNCDTVRIQFNKDGATRLYAKPKQQGGMPSPIITFDSLYNYMVDKHFSMDLHRQQDVYLRAEGIQNGKVVAVHEVRPARRPSKIMLWVDNEQQQILADGSQLVTVIAAITDAQGQIKRLNNDFIRFQVEGPATIVGDAATMANPTPVRWGTAPVLLRTTTQPGKVRLTASVLLKGSQKPVSGVLEFVTQPTTQAQLYLPAECPAIGQSAVQRSDTPVDVAAEQRQQAINAAKLKEVEQQQKDFGEKR